MGENLGFAQKPSLGLVDGKMLAKVQVAHLLLKFVLCPFVLCFNRAVRIRQARAIEVDDPDTTQYVCGPQVEPRAVCEFLKLIGGAIQVYWCDSNVVFKSRI